VVAREDLFLDVKSKLGQSGFVHTAENTKLSQIAISLLKFLLHRISNHFIVGLLIHYRELTRFRTDNGGGSRFVGAQRQLTKDFPLTESGYLLEILKVIQRFVNTYIGVILQLVNFVLDALPKHCHHSISRPLMKTHSRSLIDLSLDMKLNVLTILDTLPDHSIVMADESIKELLL